MCSHKKALQVADLLAQLRHYPAEPNVRLSIAEKLEKLCPTNADADRLLAEACETYNDWPGPQEFWAFARRLFAPEQLRPELQTFDAAKWREPIDCAACEDKGYIERAGTFERCRCEMGRRLEERFLNLLRSSAQASAECKPNQIRPTTATEVLRVIGARKKGAKR